MECSPPGDSADHQPMQARAVRPRVGLEVTHHHLWNILEYSPPGDSADHQPMQARSRETVRSREAKKPRSQEAEKPRSQEAETVAESAGFSCIPVDDEKGGQADPGWIFMEIL